MILLVTAALASDDVRFSPDRPGVGESGQTINAGHILFEAGVGAIPDPFVGAAGLVGRIGVHDAVELRVWTPTLAVADGKLGVTDMGVGAKLGTPIGERVYLNVVPEVFFPGALTVGVGTNLAVSVDRFGFWVHMRPTVTSNLPVSMLFGGGVGTSIGVFSPYLNGGGGLNTTSFVGGGTAIALGKTAQLDAGVDLALGNGTVLPVIQAGASVAF